MEENCRAIELTQEERRECLARKKANVEAYLAEMNKTKGKEPSSRAWQEHSDANRRKREPWRISLGTRGTRGKRGGKRKRRKTKRRKTKRRKRRRRKRTRRRRRR